MFNEGCIGILGILSSLMSYYVPDPNLRSKYGLILIGFVIFNLAVNLLSGLYEAGKRVFWSSKAFCKKYCIKFGWMKDPAIARQEEINKKKEAKSSSSSGDSSGSSESSSSESSSSQVSS